MSPACTRCYAERDAKRYGQKVWGKDVDRRFFGDKHWSQPKRWNKEAGEKGIRYRVFCASMADVFEARPGLDEHRARLWDLILETPHLDWLLLTKRPENMMQMGFPSHLFNAWAGTTAEDDEWWGKRVPELLKVDAQVRFISVEPMLGPITKSLTGLDWILVGGESGGGSRRMDPDWAKNLLDRCRHSDVAYHFKQLGAVLAKELKAKGKGGDPSEWPEELRVQQFPAILGV